MKKVCHILLVILTVAQAMAYCELSGNVISEVEEKVWSFGGEEENASEEESSDDHLMVKGLLLGSADGLEITHLTSSAEPYWCTGWEVIAPPPRKKDAA